MTTANKLRKYRLNKWADAMDSIEAATSGADLYDRHKRQMTHGQADTHAAAVFNMPRALVRRRRTVFGKVMGWLRIL